MSERIAFIRAICAEPDDDTARLVFADWLQENGEGERAEFIRASVRRPAMTTSYNSATNPWSDGDHGTICELLRRYGHEWLGPYYELAGGRSWAWHRGFIASITCTAADFEEHGPTIVESSPIEKVTLTSQPECGVWIRQEDGTHRRKAFPRIVFHLPPPTTQEAV